MNIKIVRTSQLVVWLLLSLLLMGANECSQQANMNMAHIGNFFSYPFQALGRVASGTTDGAINERFENYIDNSEKTSLASSANIQCGERVPASALSSITGLNQEIISRNCQCRAWDTPRVCEGEAPCCSSTLCPTQVQCPLLCPDNTHILRNNAQKAPPVESEGNYFSFVNSNFDVFANQPRLIETEDVRTNIPATNYNLGMISARRKFNELATFTGGDAPQFSGTTDFEKNSAKKEYYQQKIDRIFDGHPIDIEGYENLAEFSADPLVQTYLTQKIHDEWLEKSVGIDPFGETTADPSRHMTRERSQTLLSQVSSGIEQMGSATVIFGYVNNSTDKNRAQALEAYRVFESDDNKKVICVHDPNLPAYAIELDNSDASVGGETAPGLHFPFIDPPKDCFPKMIIDPVTGATSYLAKVREYLPEPEEFTDEDGITQTRRYRDTMLNRPLFDVRHNQTSDRRDAVTEIPRLREKCQQERGCDDV